MENLFDWVEDIKASIILEPGTRYYIECGNGFDEFVIREAFDKIFGWDKVNYCLTIEPGISNRYINIFDNDSITDSMRDGGQITFSIHYDVEFIMMLNSFIRVGLIMIIIEIMPLSVNLFQWKILLTIV